VIVWIGTTIGQDTLESWAARTFAAWGIGRKGKDDGVAIFVLSQDRHVRIEVGYGLEGQLTDAISSRIIREQMTPRLQRGDPDGAVTAAVDGVLDTLGGEAPGAERAVPEPAPHALGLGELIVIGVAGLLLLLFLITHPSLAAALLFTLGSNRRQGGWGGGGGFGGGGFGGGGFSGGGGHSGGGGASGSW
jgi:uncharacterized protein